jgi:signal transduction histidine kinase/CheY-like chemotaxis protein
MTNDNILIITNQHSIPSTLTDVLIAEHYDIVTADTTEKALEYLKTGQNFTLAIIELSNPDSESVKLIRYIQKHAPNTECITIASPAHLHTPELTVYDHIEEGFLSHRLIPAIKRCLQKQKLSTELQELQEVVHVHDMTRSIHAPDSTDDLLRLILRMICHTLGADGGSILLPAEEHGHLVVRAALGARKDDVIGKRQALGERIAGYVAETGQPVFLHGPLKNYPQFAHLKHYGSIVSSITVPLISNGTLQGVITVYRQKSDHPFSDRHMRLMLIFARESALAIENARYRTRAEQVRRDDKLQMDFLSLISHKLKTPLTTIVGYSSFLLDRFAIHDETMQRSLTLIKQESDVLCSLVDKLLRFTLLISKHTVAAPKKESLAALVDRCVKGLHLSIDMSKVNLQVNKEIKSLPSVYVDSMKIIEALENLIENAIKFNPGGNREVTITAHTLNDRWVVVEVLDNGPGILPQEHTRIFDQFYQIDTFGTAQVEGIGLGLSLVKRIIELHGGNVWVESAPDKGSKFSFTIPLYNQIPDH